MISENEFVKLVENYKTMIEDIGIEEYKNTSSGMELALKARQIALEHYLEEKFLKAEQKFRELSE